MRFSPLHCAVKRALSNYGVLGASLMRARMRKR